MSSGAPIAQVFAFWKDFQFEEFRGRLDGKGLAVAEHQESSVNSRKRLAEITKDFRRNANSDAVQQVGALLRHYQAEVDQLTARAKFGETAFLEIYQTLYEAPDPAPSLAHALELASHNAEVQAQMCKIAQELAEYKAESKDLKNQDGTIRRLEERVRSLEAQLQEKERQLEEAVISSEAAESLQAAQETAEREDKLLVALSEAQSSLVNLQKLHEASQKQLFNMQSRTEEEQVGMQFEVEIATAEMERAQQRLMTLEREKEGLVAQVTLGKDSQPSAALMSRQNEDGLRAELRSQRELVSRLHSELSSLSMRADEDADAMRSRCEGLRSALRAQEGHAEALEQELTTRPTVNQVEELRQQLRLMQAVGLGALEFDDGGLPGMAGPGVMEALLLEKARKLEHLLTVSRLQVAQTSGEAELASAKVTDLETLLRDKEALIAYLEEDLLAAKPGSKAEAKYATLLGSGDSSEAGDGGERSMVAVLCSQRDRFRKRASELEEENMQMDRERKGAKRELDSARADNVALVERLRYVQGYRSKNLSDVESGHIENKYDTAYEAKMNPFSDWKQREKASRKKQLSIADRMMYECGQFISSSQKARMFVVAYVVALHLMVFWVIARWGHGPSHHIGGTELQLLCTRQAHGHNDDASFSRK